MPAMSTAPHGTPRDAELFTLTASALSLLLDRRQVSPVEILGSVLARIDALNPHINAFCHLARDTAYKAADEAERRLLRGTRHGPLDGIPFSVKDNLFVASMPATWGSRLYADFVPETDDLAPAALARAGALCLGKTNTPEFALSSRTENDLFGTTCNPLDETRTPGGSSGGAAAAVAAGMGPIAIATDAGGSIRRPSSYCGLVGLKASPGAVPRRFGFPATVHDFQTVGPIARNVADVQLAFDAVRGTKSAPVPIGAKRIALIVSGEAITVDDAVQERVSAVAGYLADMGHEVEEIAAPWNPAEIDSIWTILSAAGMARIARLHEINAWRSGATRASQNLAEAGEKLSAVDYVGALDRLAALRRTARDWFDRQDFFFTPSSPCTAWACDEPYPNTIGGAEAGPRGAAAFATFVNAGGLAAISLPIGHDSTGLPIGGQFVGRAGADDALLAIAAELEAQVSFPSP